MASLASLPVDALVTVGVVLGVVGALVSDWGRPDLVLLGGLAVLLVTGVVPPSQAFAGFSNSAVLTVGALYIVAGGVQHTDALAQLDRVLFAKSSRLELLLARFMVPTSLLSGLLNNTPIVAMLTPRLQTWADKQGIPASKLMIPLSYAAITGGMTTLVGTSTNLIVAGLMEAEGYEPLHLFDVTWIGVPAAGAVIAYFVLGGHRLLPDRGTSAPPVETELDTNMFEVKVTEQASRRLSGQTVAEAGLRDLGDAYLTHVRRNGRVQQATPRLTLEQGDVLAFNGSLAARERLLERSGLKRTLPSPDGRTDDPARYETLPLYEAVIAESSNLVGATLEDVNFREEYQGVVLGIQRQNEPMTGPVGDTRLQAGDLLIVEAPTDFEKRWSSGSRDEFYLVAPRDGRARTAARDEEDEDDDRSARAPLALALTGGMVLAAATGVVPIVTAAFIAALLMILTGCVTTAEAQRALNVQVLVVIAAALGVGKAIETTGIAREVAGAVIGATEAWGPVATLAAIYLLTNLLTEIITNNAAAVLMLPISMAAASSLGAPPIAFGLIVAIGASASFLTPIGYQTNLMVMSPGGYRFSDYAKVGWPVTILVMTISVTVISLLWL
ncbi:MAG: SLC13 family permease [Bacteroidetes bacterium SW_9_63_38]|nr:MAG: SLC13 family permease [Bacteroidetes bacterium SW_9_63_38]